jgi:uncharacterized membrane protein
MKKYLCMFRARNAGFVVLPVATTAYIVMAIAKLRQQFRRLIENERLVQALLFAASH